MALPSYDKPTYTLIPNKALDCLLERNHSNAAVLVYQVLCRHYNLKTNQCWPSLTTIAKLSGLDKRNVSRSLKTLSETGMILRTQSKSSNNSFDRNIYYLPHLISFQIESLQSEKKTASTTKLIKELKELESFVLKSIMDGRGTMSLGRGNKPLGGGRKAEGRGALSSGVVAQSPTNNTTINTTINITKNVNENSKHETNDDIPQEFKRFDLKPSSRIPGSPEQLNAIPTLSIMKRESLAQHLANELNDPRSISFFRNVASKFLDHEDILYKCLSLTKEVQEISGIKKSKGAVFTDIIKREALKLGINV